MTSSTVGINSSVDASVYKQHHVLHWQPYEVRGAECCETQDVREATELSGIRGIVGQLVAVSLATSLLPAGYRVTERASDAGGKKTPV